MGSSAIGNLVFEIEEWQGHKSRSVAGQVLEIRYSVGTVHFLHRPSFAVVIL